MKRSVLIGISASLAGAAVIGLVYDLKGAVNELTVVMRELVQQNTPPMTTSGSVRVSRVEPRTCHLALYLDGEGPYRCVRESGHAGDHKDADHVHWRVGPVKS
jgi:hypothetical protein